MDEELDNIIVLNDEEGNEVQFEILDIIDHENEQFIVLLPIDEQGEEDEGEVVILKIEDTDEVDENGEETESFVSVDDEETLLQVFEIFKERHADEFDFVDEE